MDNVILGKTGLSVSPICFGTWQLGGDWGPTDEAAAVAAIERGRELGINFFDTAAGYGWGESERTLARALGDDLRTNRGEIVIATKGGLNLSDGKLQRDSSRDWLRQGVEQSLEALGVDYIDLYQVHWPDKVAGLEETAVTLGELVDEGLIRHVGVSNFTVEEMESFSAVRPVETLQPPFSLFRRGIEDETLPYCERENIGVLVYGPLAHGLLGGRITPDTTFNEGDWRSANREFKGEGFARNLEVSKRLAGYARDTLGCSLPELALAWVLGRPGITVAIVGTRNADHVAQAVRATELELTEQNLTEIEAIVAEAQPLVGVTPESF